MRESVIKFTILILLGSALVNYMIEKNLLEQKIMINYIELNTVAPDNSVAIKTT